MVFLLVVKKWVVLPIIIIIQAMNNKNTDTEWGQDPLIGGTEISDTTYYMGG